jgi:hypothetical protein
MFKGKRLEGLEPDEVGVSCLREPLSTGSLGGVSANDSEKPEGDVDSLVNTNDNYVA